MGAGTDRMADERHPDESMNSIDLAARALIASGCGPFDADGVRWALKRIGVTGQDAVAFAPQLVNAALRIFDDECRPFVHTFTTPVERCYSEPCTPKGRCSHPFAFGIEVEHSTSGERWAVEGREYPNRLMAERHARLSVLLMRLRSDEEWSPDSHRRKGAK